MKSWIPLLSAIISFCLMAPTQAQVVGFATNPQGSALYGIAAAVAGVMQDKAKISTRVMPTSGSTAYAPLINRGQMEFGMLNAVDVSNAYNGVGNFKGRKLTDLRLVGVIYPLPIALAVPYDSPVKEVKDLKGLRMPSKFTAQSTIQTGQDALLAAGGLSTEDMKQFPVPDFVKGMQALAEGKVDAALFCFSCSGAQEAQVGLAARGGARFLSLPDTPEAEAALRKVFPAAYTQVFQPTPALPWIHGPTRIIVYSVFVVASKDAPEDLVYRATKTIYENKDALQTASPLLKTFDPKAMAEASIVPYHPGAQKFYAEMHMWPPKKR